MKITSAHNFFDYDVKQEKEVNIYERLGSLNVENKKKVSIKRTTEEKKEIKEKIKDWIKTNRGVYYDRNTLLVQLNIELTRGMTQLLFKELTDELLEEGYKINKQWIDKKVHWKCVVIDIHKEEAVAKE